MRTRSAGQILFGIIVLALGVGFLLDALGLVSFGQVIGTWWPLIIIAIGVTSLLSNPRVIMWPLVIVVVGILLQFRQLGWVDFNVWRLIWPALVILFGLSLLFNIGKSKDKSKSVNNDTVDLFVAFSGNKARSIAKDFKGGKAVALFGGIELDLKDAKIKDRASLDIFTAFGGVDVTVPEGWVVNVSGLPLFGGWEDKTQRPKDDKNAPILTINGTCMFGGVTVKN